ncbi:50S ribosomal protein L10 [Patescibacteria group bacterium]|nr:50S ribosomal protein L10 [Patescibacteria group bacterium]
MAKTRKQKEEIVNQLEKDLKGIKSLVFVDYSGLKVGQVDELKKNLKENSCQYFVAKKTLLNLVFQKIGLGHIDLSKIQGGLGLAYSLEDEVAPIRVAFKFAKENDEVKINGGIMGDEFLASEKAKILSTLPSREELIAKLLSTIKAPINNLAYVLKGNLRGLVYILSSINK